MGKSRRVINTMKFIESFLDKSLTMDDVVAHVKTEHDAEKILRGITARRSEIMSPTKEQAEIIKYLRSLCAPMSYDLALLFFPALSAEEAWSLLRDAGDYYSAITSGAARVTSYLVQQRLAEHLQIFLQHAEQKIDWFDYFTDKTNHNEEDLNFLLSVVPAPTQEMLKDMIPEYAKYIGDTN